MNLCFFGVVKSEEVVVMVCILVDKLVDIRYMDIFVFMNELGEIIECKLKEINVKWYVSGKLILIEVIV